MGILPLTRRDATHAVLVWHVDVALARRQIKGKHLGVESIILPGYGLANSLGIEIAPRASAE